MDGNDESPARGLKNMLSRSRRGRAEALPDRSDSHSARGDSSESGPEKFKPRPSVVEGATEQADPKAAKITLGRNKRKDKRNRSDNPSSKEDSAQSISKAVSLQGLGITDIGSPRNTVPDGDGESITTSDSEIGRESTLAMFGNAPDLESHNSHSGYLTSSSPMVKVAPVEETITAGTTNALGNFPTGSSLSVNSVESGRSRRSRSKSPGKRIKEVFRPNSKQSNDFQSTLRSSPAGNSNERDATQTLASRRLSKGGAEDVQPPSYVHTSKSYANQSNKSLPSIVMTPETPPPLPTSSYERLPALVKPPAQANQTEDEELANGKTDKTDDHHEAGSDNPGNASFMSFAHRRARSESQTNAPTKLSHSMNPPLTPMIEEVKTPPSRHAATTSSGGGFFTSVFSAAQNAATTFTTTLTSTHSRPKSSMSQTLSSEDDNKREPLDPDTVPAAESATENGAESVKPLAIDTIGSGDLSLSHLGIGNDASPNPSVTPTPSRPVDQLQSRSRSGTVIRREEAAAREEGISAARAVSAAYEEKLEDIMTPVVEDVQEPRIIQVTREGSVGDRTTPNGSVVEGESGSLLRTGSLKNKIDQKRRRRGGSLSTLGGATLTAGGSLINAASPNPPTSNTPKLHGFAVASKKRNRDFHSLFRSVPEEDYLIEDYSCALQRDIILAGRIYISEGHICFSSNILGWVTTLVISFDEVVSVEKESTAMVFPNAIAIQTLHARHTFRSLLSRETTYDLLIGIWKINHPGLMSSENGVQVANGTGSKTEKLEAGSEKESVSSGDDHLNSGNASDESDEDEPASSVGSGEADVQLADVSTSPPKSTIPQKPSNAGSTIGQAIAPPTVSDSKAVGQANGAAMASVDYPGPQAHAPTECSDGATHYSTLLKDESIPAPLGKIFAMIFGNASGGFMSRWLLDEMKVLDLQMEDDKKGLGDENKSRGYSYIKPLAGAIGPKQTKCIITEQLDSFDLEKAVSVTVTTQTPDVPSGNVFSVKTRYCLMWGPNNSTRMIMTCTIEWTGKSWLKGPIEKGANDGQVTYANDLYKALRAAVSKGKATASTPGKKKSKKRTSDDAEKSTTSLARSAENKNSDWGLFEPVHGIFGPVLDLLGPLFSLHALVILLFLLLVYSWLRGPAGASISSGKPNIKRSARLAAYEELWRSEESALWSWLEQRLGGEQSLVISLSKSSSSGRSNADRGKTARNDRQQVILGENGRPMSEKEVTRAMEITEERLRMLKQKVKSYHATGEPVGKSEL